MRSVLFSSTRSSRFISEEFPPNFIDPGKASISQIIPSCMYLVLSRTAYWFNVVIFVVQLLFPVPLGFQATLTPLIGTFVTAIVLDIIIFVRRNRLLAQIDRKKVTVLREHAWVEIPWTAVAVGDIIKLANGDVAPADLALLCTVNGASCGIGSHIIDGSQHMKARMPLRDLHELARPEVVKDCEFVLNYTKECDDPMSLTSKIQFSGTIVSGERIAQLGNSQFIERYSVIYHNSDVICGVLYTGSDCRTVRNNMNAVVKFTKLEKMLNIQNVIQIALCVFIALVVAGCSVIFRGVSEKWPFLERTTLGDYFINNFRNYIVLLLPIIPIELYMVLDVILVIHSMFMQSDMQTTVASISVIDELTQVDTIVASKSVLIGKNTNIMRVFVGDIVYGQTITSCHLASNIDSDLYRVRADYSRQFEDDRLVANDSTRIFFLHLALCHSAVPVVVNDHIGYVSNFAGDEALLKLASSYGFVLTKRQGSELIVTMENKPHAFKILNMFPPSPQHPRVSILFRDIDGSVKMFIRGDVEVMREYTEIPANEECQFKGEGLRVACCSVKSFTMEEFMVVQRRLMQARTESADFIFNLISDMEKGSTFLSLVAFEEEPRKGALKLIHEAQNAGIQIVLTSSGKAASAALTALSLGMISSSQQAGILAGDDKESISECVQSLISSAGFDVLTVSGQAVDFLPMIGEASRLVDMIKGTSVILLEKMDPIQVQQFVRFLRHYCHNTVLGIGHNITDSVYMEKANVSVSINMDSVSPCDLASDITTKELDSVTRLVFVHGGLLRERLAALLTFIFPRNTVYALMQCVYGFHSALSGTPLFSAKNVFLTLYVFTLLPCLSRAIFNQKAPSALLKGSPDYYKRSKVSRFSLQRILAVNIFSILAAIVLLECSVHILHNVRFPYNDTLSHEQFSFAVDSSFVVCCICFLVPLCQTWTRVHHLFVWGSLFFYFVTYGLSTDSEAHGRSRGAVSTLTSLPVYSLLMVFYAGTSLFIVFCYIIFHRFLCNSTRRLSSSPLMEQDLLSPDDPEANSTVHVVNVPQLYRL